MASWGAGVGGRRRAPAPPRTMPRTTVAQSWRPPTPAPHYAVRRIKQLWVNSGPTLGQLWVFVNILLIFRNFVYLHRRHRGAGFL